MARENQRPANPVDEHVGSRVKLRRTLLGMSQGKVGEALGLTFQQVQKYERGVNRVGASRLLDLSRILDVPISLFFDDMPDANAVQTKFHAAANQTGARYLTPEQSEILEIYDGIPRTLRASVRDVLRGLKASGNEFVR